MDEQLLLLKCKQHDQRAEAELFEHYKPRMLHWAGKYFKQPEDAWDVVMEAITDFFEQIDRVEYRHPGNIAAYIRQILFFRCCERMTDKSKRAKLMADMQEDEQEEVEGHGLRDLESDIAVQQIDAYLDALPEELSAVFRLKEDGFSHEDIAGLLDIPLGTSLTRLRLAKDALQIKILVNDK